MTNTISASLTIKNKTYYAVISFYENGIRKQKWVSTKIKESESKRKAEKKLIQIRDEFIQNLNNVSIVKASNNDMDMPFIDFMLKWLNMIKHQIQESTYTGYKRQIEGRMKNYFTSNPVMLSELKPIHIIDFYNHLYSQGLKGTTVVKYHANIRKALDYAVKTDLIQNNPVLKVDRPVEEQYISDHYNEDELNLLFKIIKNTTLEVIVTLAAFFGLRRSEVLGLKWSAIDFENKTITISSTVVKAVCEDEDSKTKTKLISKSRTKNKSSYRTLPLFSEIENLLLSVKKKQEYYMSEFKSSYNKQYIDYICVDEMGKLRSPDYVSHKFKEILEKNNLRHIRFHDLRHSCGSLLVKKGVPLRNIQEWLGHSSSKTTERYTHLDSSSKLKPKEALENALSFDDNKKDILD